MFKPNSQLRAVKANKELPKKLLQPELIQLSSLRLRHQLKLKLLLVQELVQLPLLPLVLQRPPTTPLSRSWKLAYQIQ